MIPCEGGSYSHLDYQEACISCPPGYYCPTGSTDPIICPAGSFCFANSASHTLCPLGKYMPDTGAAEDCLACPAGSYCATSGLSAPTGLCDAGYYCTQLAYVAQPTSLAQGGGKAQQGYYTDAGAGFPLQCPPGKACPNSGMTALMMTQDTTYSCQAGYYCVMGAIKTNPTSEGSQGGDQCTTGHYCELGTTHPVPCPPGTYLGTRGGTALSSCIDCPADSYCEHYGSTTYLTCDEGWYCEGNEVSPTPWDSVNNVPKVCEVGHYCTAGRKTACSGKY